MVGFVSFLYEYADSVAILLLSAMGLIIIFGMMGVINMAHGEMMMIGAYITSFGYYAGIPLVLDPLLGGVGGAIAGILIERLIIQRFYGQLLSSLVVTWGLSLILSQGALLLFGQLIKTVPTPFASFTVGEFSFAYYRVFLMIVALAMLFGLWLLFTQTRFRNIRSSHHGESGNGSGDGCRHVAPVYDHLRTWHWISGHLRRIVSTNFHNRSILRPRIYFASIHNGCCGRRRGYFVGALASVLSLGAIRTVVTAHANILIGNVAMLVFAFVVVLFMPAGISEWIEKKWITRTK